MLRAGAEIISQMSDEDSRLRCPDSWDCVRLMVAYSAKCFIVETLAPDLAVVKMIIDSPENCVLCFMPNHKWYFANSLKDWQWRSQRPGGGCHCAGAGAGRQRPSVECHTPHTQHHSPPTRHQRHTDSVTGDSLRNTCFMLIAINTSQALSSGRCDEIFWQRVRKPRNRRQHPSEAEWQSVNIKQDNYYRQPH